MTDITLAFDGQTLAGDFVIAGGDLQTGNDLQSSVIISLFTNQGWWADAFSDVPIGSRLSELYRAKATNQTRLQAENYASAALQWLITDGVAASVDVAATYVNGTSLMLVIVITQPSPQPPLTLTASAPVSGGTVGTSFSWVWDAV